jgi:hypothetical protein
MRKKASRPNSVTEPGGKLSTLPAVTTPPKLALLAAGAQEEERGAAHLQRQ